MTYRALVLHSDYTHSNIRLLYAAIVDYCAMELVVSMCRSYTPAIFPECIYTQNGQLSGWLLFCGVINTGEMYIEHRIICFTKYHLLMIPPNIQNK